MIPRVFFSPIDVGGARAYRAIRDLLCASLERFLVVGQVKHVLCSFANSSRTF
jgi:hypothetical protein